MQPTAIATNPAPIPPKTVKERPISKRLRKVIDLLVSGECKTQKAACVRVNMHPDHVCRELKKPQVQAFIARRTRETISAGTMRASARLIELVDASSEHVSLDASKHVLAIEGIRPPDQSQVNVNVGVSVGYVIDLSGSQASVIDAKVTHD
jgi:hypothetical protein